MIKIKRGIAQCNNFRFFYLDTVNNSETIFCLHGKWGRGETWTELISRYAVKYRVIAPDQRGHGLSDKPIARYAPSDMAEDSYLLLKQLNSLPAIVVGHSMGGRNAAYLAAAHPEAVKALVIIDIGPGGEKNMPKTSPSDIVPIDLLTAEWPAPYATREEALLHLRSCFKYKSNIDYFLQSLTEGIDGYDYMFSRYSMSAISHYLTAWFDILPKIKCPVLLIRAENSSDLTREEAEFMRGVISNCVYAEISGSDHMAYIDNPDEFYPVFEDFLKNLPDSKL